MITNMPTADDFTKHGLTFLQFAWDAVFDLLLGHTDAQEWNQGVDAEESKNYWRAANKPLSIAHALAQQGAEMILKAKIAEKSPYLLISGHPKDWPKGGEEEGIAFADFRTIDAQDLIRVCNTACDESLPEQFATSYKKFRNQRNALFHTVDNRLDYSAEEVVAYILNIAHLIAPREWPRLREKYLEEQPLSQLGGGDGAVNRLCREMQHMINLMGKADLQFFFEFDKKQRPYICPHCYGGCNHDYDVGYPRTALLKPKSPQSTNLYCFVCGNDIPVMRKECAKEACEGNVIHTEIDFECLTCFEAQEDIE
jgi:hypothetical protein